MGVYRRVLVGLVTLITLALVAPWGAPKAVADEDRPGCSTYCQNAGGYGAPGGPKPPPALTPVSTNVTADADGYIPVTLRCNLQVQCMGYLSIGGGKADLLVNGGATRTIGVPMSPEVFASLKSNGPTTLGLLIDAAQAPGTQCQEPYNEGCTILGGPGGFPYSYVILDDHLTVAPPG